MVLFRSFQVVRTKLGLLCRKGGSLKLRDKPAFPKLTPNLPKSQVVSTGDFGKFNPAICPQWQLTENVTSQALRDFTSGLAVTLQERQSLHSSRSIRTLAMLVAALGLSRVTGNPEVSARQWPSNRPS